MFAAEVDVMYSRKYSSLHEVVRLIAYRLAAANQHKFADADAAIDDARRQILDALFEGAVRGEGVRCHPADPPTYDPVSVDYDEWHLIDKGVWAHERCEVMADCYRLNTISVHWNEDFIDYFNSDDDWAEYIDWKIRLFCEDINREFPATEMPTEASARSGAPTKQDYRTALPGRPSPKYLALQEMQRRTKEGTLCSGIGAEMRELCRWLKQEHPQAPSATPKALETALRDEYWRLRRGMNL
jgi:hypothetical protein